MKKNFLIHGLLLILTFLFVGLISLSCTKDKESSSKFCNTDRVEYLSVNQKIGAVGYYEKYNRWAIYTNISTSDNIDSRIVGLVCGLPEKLQIKGLKVLYTGKYYKFNSDENISPQIGGEKIFYLTIEKSSEK